MFKAHKLPKLCAVETHHWKTCWYCYCCFNWLYCFCYYWCYCCCTIAIVSPIGVVAVAPLWHLLGIAPWQLCCCAWSALLWHFLHDISHDIATLDRITAAPYSHDTSAVLWSAISWSVALWCIGWKYCAWRRKQKFIYWCLSIFPNLYVLSQIPNLSIEEGLL